MRILLAACAFFFSVGIADAQRSGEVDTKPVPEVGVIGGLASLTLVGGLAALGWERRRRRQKLGQ